MRYLIAALALVVSSCYLADPDTGECDTPTEDRVYIDNGTIEPGMYCYDDGDGYPTIAPPITTVPGYPTTGGA